MADNIVVDSTIKGTAEHEAWHYWHATGRKSSKDLFGSNVEDLFTSNREWIGMNISKYAASDWQEFLAESLSYASRHGAAGISNSSIRDWLSQAIAELGL